MTSYCSFCLRWQGNCWSAIGMHEENHTTFKYIAEARYSNTAYPVSIAAIV
jgi:hypothetical protein